LPECLLFGTARRSRPAFLLHFNTNVLTRSREFNFANGSVGNFFFTGACWISAKPIARTGVYKSCLIELSAPRFTGARLLFGSLEAAIFLFSGIARISRKTEVVPIINLNFEGITLGALLANGTRRAMAYITNVQDVQADDNAAC